MLVNNETGVRQPLAEIAALVRGARAATPSLHTDAVQAPQWLDLRAAAAPRRPRRDLRPQVRRPEGRRRARRARRRASSCRSSKAAGTSATCAPARRTSRASSRSPPRCALTDERRAEETSRASRRCATGSSGPARRTSPGFAPNGDPRAPGRGAAARRVRRRRGRDVARRARPAGRLRGVGLGVQLRRDRSVARAARDGHAARPRAVVGAVLARLRVDRRRRRRGARDRSPRSSRSCAPHEPVTVMVMMSGGVDSSVAAALLREQGHDVTGVTLKLWGGESDSGCCSVGDVEDARRVAAQLGIPHYVFNFTDDFDAHVVEPYVDAYAAGTTPNPCVECNRTMKWGRAFDAGAPARLRLRRDRSPRACRRRRRARARARRRRGQGPVVRALHARRRTSSRARCCRSAS